MSSLGTKLITNVPFSAILLLLAGLPFYGQFMPYFEGAVWPVTTPISILSTTPADDGLDIRFAYSKLRACERIGAYIKQGTMEVGFEPIGSDPSTIGLGISISRLWHVELKTLTRAEIWFVYRCNPLWITISKVYP